MVPDCAAALSAKGARSLIWSPYQAARRATVELWKHANISSFRRMNAQSAGHKGIQTGGCIGASLAVISGSDCSPDPSNGRRHARKEQKESCCCVRATSDVLLVS